MRDPGFVIVAIDGGAASGKSTTARELSRRYHLLHVDTGSFYRFVTHELLAAGAVADPGREAAVEAVLAALRTGTRIVGREAQMEIGGRTPGPEIRGPEVDAAVSQFAALPVVRRFLLGYQRAQAVRAREGGFAGLVMEGRDIGSVIFPDAPVRVFLTADAEARARRRAAEGRVDAVAERDRRDATRATAPMRVPEGAVVIDTTDLPVEAVADRVAALVEAAMGGGGGAPQ